MIDRLDHVVLARRDLAAKLAFYSRGPGMVEHRSEDGRTAFAFGLQQINLHAATGAAILSRADRPTPGSADSA